ncbi:MAG: flagellar protein [Negativicutes bacterium]|nr:flagellar protein [Negativicutes bacterium]
MDPIYCTECEKLCVDNPSKLCRDCLNELLEAEITVADYLRANENQTVDEVHQGTKVKKHIIFKMIREGRIIEGKLSYSCETCSTSITAGRYCLNCLDEAFASETENENSDENKTAEDSIEAKGMHITRSF